MDPLNRPIKWRKFVFVYENIIVTLELERKSSTIILTEFIEDTKAVNICDSSTAFVWLEINDLDKVIDQNSWAEFRAGKMKEVSEYI